MFYQYNKKLNEISIDEVSYKFLTLGYIDKAELPELYEKFGFDESTVKQCCESKKYRSVVETYDDYTFGILHVVGDINEEDDWIAVYVRQNMFLIVELVDRDESNEKIFNDVISKFRAKNPNVAKFILAFFERLTLEDVGIIEKISDQINKLESSLLSKEVNKEFNISILALKKHMQRLHYYYEHILDIVETVYENENDILDYDSLIHINNLIHRLERLNEDTISINSSLEHLQDAYFSYLDMKMNSTMKILTVLTTIFFPLTIIVGWYGMNFQSMPEFAWKYGYAYVIVLSIVVMVGLIIIAKKGKWFK